MTSQRIIDVHAHVLPQKVFDKIWAYFDQHHWPIYYRTGEAERAAYLEAHTAAYTTLCYAHRAGMAAWLNDYALAYAQAHPKAIAMGTFHPDDADAADYVAEGLKRGLQGFKLHLEVQKFNPADPRLQRVYDLVTEAGAVLVVHTAGQPLPGPWTGPEHFARMLAMAPRVPMIIAHMGGPEFPAYLRYADHHRLYFDTAMVGVNWAGFGTLDEATLALVRRHADRIVFGSDFPSIPYDWAHQVATVKSWGLSREQLEAVFWRTAAGIFGLDEAKGR